jgi:hypothetical protein
VLTLTFVLALFVFAAAANARVPAHQQAWQYRWSVWLPENWQKLGACETGYGRRPGNWKHANSSYVSAFGISRREYDRDAAYMGAPPWNDANPPTPWHQYRAAVGHLRRFGDGWGCPGP